MKTYLIVLGLLVLFFLDLFTIAYKAALLNASLARLLSLKEEMETRVTRVVNLLHTPQEWLAAGNLVQLFTRLLGAGLLLALFLPQAWTVSNALIEIGILLLAVVVVFWLEWVLEVAVTRHPETWAMRLAPNVRTLTVILSPLLVLPLAIGRRRGEAQEPVSTVTEAELKSMVDAGHEGGVLEGDERQMIYSIFELGDTLVREIMLPRIYITALEVSIPLSEAVDALLKSGHSRVPVYEESVDNILGILYAKDLLRVWRQGQPAGLLKELLRPAIFVPEAKKVDELLEEMQAGHVHMAMVVDEYGGIAGLVTLEDIFEEIVGEIQDEYDQTEEAPYTQVGEGEFVFQGRVDLRDFNEVMGSQLPTEETETLGGFIYEQVGRVPASGESLQVGDILLTIEQVTGRRIRKVRAKKLPQATQEEQLHGDQTD
ncbi:MAG TPA: hemolysin family protein [Anaerolineales bacterium]|nr:hemolysin family protein [Anaerolineales bacterium]